MKIPHSKRKKALIVVDTQPDFLDDRNKYIINNISALLKKIKYDLYIEAVFYTEKGSVWDKQEKFILPKGKNIKTVDKLAKVLKKYKPMKTLKQTKSAFKGEDIDLVSLLKEKKITEVHVVGTETNDCVLATAFDAFDLGFITYVIEECCQSSSNELHQIGLIVLRKQNMTNNSIIE